MDDFTWFVEFGQVGEQYVWALLDMQDYVHFWRNAADQAWFKQHPALQGLTEDQLFHTIPLALHCDGAEMYTNCEFYVWSVSSLLPCEHHGRHVLDDKFQFLKIPHESMRDAGIKADVMRWVPMYIAWNCDITATGTPPAHDFYGNAWQPGTTMEQLHHKGVRCLFGPWRAIFAGVKSDLKAKKEMHFLNRSYQHMHMCDECTAVQPFPSVLRSPALQEHLYTDVSPGASWRASRRSHEAYMLEPVVSPWTIIPGFRRELMFWDYMHLGPLGVYRDVVAGACLDLLLRGHLDALGESHDAKLCGLWIAFREWCKSKQRQPPTGSLSMRLIGRTTAANFPELHSRYKAVTTKWLLVFISEFCNGRCMLREEHDKVLAACLWAASEFVYVTDHTHFILSDHEIERLRHAQWLFEQTCAWLCGATKVDKIFRPRPKFHYMAHLQHQCEDLKINPRDLACWEDESFLGLCCRLTKACHGASVLRTSLQRYMICLGLRWMKD